MFILIVSRGFPSSLDVMNGNFEADQAKALHALGHKVVVISVDRRLRAKDRHIGINHRIVDGIDVYNFFMIPIPVKTLYKIGYFYILLVARLFSSVILKNHGKPDIIHAHYLYTMPIAIELKKIINVPCVGTEHWGLVGKHKIMKHVRFYAERTYHRLDCLIAVSNSLKLNIIKQFGIEGVVIPNILDVSTFNRCDKEFSSSIRKPELSFTFISVGALVEGKCFDLLIRAFSKLSIENKHLIIIGGGPQKKDLENVIISLGLEKAVEMTGVLCKDDIFSKLQVANVFVLPSESETFGVVYIEAMATGLPVIATKCGGPEDFVCQSNGLLINLNNEKQLVDAMEYMYRHFSEYNPESISNDIVNKYSPDIIARQLECLYNRIICEK